MSRARFSLVPDDLEVAPADQCDLERLAVERIFEGELLGHRLEGYGKRPLPAIGAVRLLGDDSAGVGDDAAAGRSPVAGVWPRAETDALNAQCRADET
jgi:hypothetical protein